MRSTATRFPFRGRCDFVWLLLLIPAMWIVVLLIYTKGGMAYPLKHVSNLRETVPSGQLCVVAGYLSNEFENIGMTAHRPERARSSHDGDVDAVWVDWNKVSPLSSLSSLHTSGYAVIAGRLEKAEKPEFGHMGMSKMRIAEAVLLLPPWPIAIVIIAILTLGITTLLHFGRKFWSRKKGREKPSQAPTLGGTH